MQISGCVAFVTGANRPNGMGRAFAPVLKANGGGTIVNIASIVSFANIPLIGSYSASKAAVQSLTQACGRKWPNSLPV